jgi:putative membrane protein
MIARQSIHAIAPCQSRLHQNLIGWILSLARRSPNISPMSKKRKKLKEMADRVERAVAACEERTSVEYVVVFASKSGIYADAHLHAGLILAAAMLLFLVFAPFTIAPWGIPLDVAAAFLLGWLAGRYSETILRFLTTKTRRAAQVREGVALAAVRQGLFHTRDRTGLLIYVSWFERRAEFIADAGIQGAAPRDQWNLAAARIASSAFDKDFPESFVSALTSSADLLGKYLPPVGDNPNEIPNRPVLM